MAQLRHVAVAKGYAHGDAACGFGGEDVVFGIAHHDDVCHVHAEHLGDVAQRLGAGFFVRQGVAADDDAEIAIQLQGFEQFHGEYFVFVGDDGKRDAQRLQQRQACFGFGVGAGAVGDVVGVVSDKGGVALLPLCFGGGALRVVGEGAVYQHANAVAHIALHGGGGQGCHAERLAHGVSGGGEVGDGVAECAV